MHAIMAALLFFMLAVGAYAQPTQIITGTVTDAETGQPIAFANVVVTINGKVSGGVTDSLGNYYLANVQVGKADLACSFVGYKIAYLAGIDLVSGKVLVQDFHLVPQSVFLNEVTILSEDTKSVNELASVSVNKINMLEGNKYAAGFSDVSRMAQTMAGVAPSDASNNTIIVRGNNPSGLIWMLEGNEIPNPNHFPTGTVSSGGGISIISAENLSNSDFLVSAFPAEYGNATSAVFDLNHRKGNLIQHEHYFRLSTLGIEAGSEGPLTKAKNSSYIVKYRYSTLGLLGELIPSLGFGTLPPTYQDLVFNTHFKLKKAGTLNFYGVVGVSYAGNKAIRDPRQWIYTGDNQDYRTLFNTSVAGLKHNVIFRNNTTSLRTVLSYNLSLNQVTEDTLDLSLRTARTFERTIQFNTGVLSQRLTMRPNVRNLFRAGYIFSVPDYKTIGSFLNEDRVMQKLFNDRGTTAMVQAYATHQHRPSEKITINYGLHLLHLFLNNRQSVEPRLAVSYQIRENQSLNFGTGLHSRAERINVYLLNVNDNGVLDSHNRSLGFQKSLHTVIGHQLELPSRVNVKTEVYYQYLFNIPVSADPMSSFSVINDYNFNERLVNEGTGRNYGLELTMEKRYSNLNYFLFTTSLFNSTYETLSRKTYNTRFNRSYVFNLVAGRDFYVNEDKTKMVGINGRALLMGGDRTTPIDLAASIRNNQQTYFPDAAFTKQFPTFYRFDFGVYIQKNKKKSSWKLSLDIQNVTNHKSVVVEYYNASRKGIQREFGLGFIPVINYKYDF
jgi:hypothetical protein